MFAQTKSNFFLMLAVIAFLLVSGVALTLGVKRPVDKTIFINEASEVETAEPGKTEIEGGVIYDFPQFPVYPGANIVSSYKKEEGDRVGFSTSWVSGEPVGEITNWYVGELQDLGWIILISPDPDPLGEYSEQFIQVAYGELKANIIIEAGEGKYTQIDIEFPIQPLEFYGQ